MSIEPFSYFRPRGITESSRNVLAKGLSWLDENVEAIKENVIKIYYHAESIVVETWKAGVLMTQQTYQVGEKFAVNTFQSGEKYATEVYQTSKKIIINAVNEGQQLIVTSLDTLQKNATELQQKIEQSYQRVSDTISSTIQSGVKAVEEVLEGNKAGWAYQQMNGGEQLKWQSIKK